MLKIAMKNTLTQWIGTNTRFRGDDQPFRLHLVFMKDPEIIGRVTYDLPSGKSDHVMIKFLMNENLSCIRKEDHKIGRLNYKKAKSHETLFCIHRLERL